MTDERRDTPRTGPEHDGRSHREDPPYPLERRRRIGVVGWLLALGLLGFFGWFAVDMWSDAPEADVEPAAEEIGEVAPAEAEERALEAAVPEAPIADLATIALADRPGDLLGEDAELTGVPVESVLGPGVFWVGSPAQRVLVVLEEAAEPARTATEEGEGAATGAVELEAGQTVSLNGSINPIPDDIDAVRASWNLPDGDLERLLGDAHLYILAEDVRVQS